MITRFLAARRTAYRPQVQARQDALRNEKLAASGLSHPQRRSLLRRAGAWLLAPASIAGGTALVLDMLTMPATAAQNRHFPDNTQLGRIRFGQFPDATLNGKPVRLGPGARILNQDNLIVPPIAVHGKSYVVGYVTDTMGMIMTVWILSEEEYRALRRQHGR